MRRERLRRASGEICRLFEFAVMKSLRMVWLYYIRILVVPVNRVAWIIVR